MEPSFQIYVAAVIMFVLYGVNYKYKMDENMNSRYGIHRRSKGGTRKITNKNYKQNTFKKHS
jgi:hypothetical protein